MIQLAYTLILKAFSDKFDKGGEPYIFHLERVAAPFKEDEILYTIALLHDIIEDCEDWDIDKLTKHFPMRVCEAVKCLTKLEGENYADYLQKVSHNDDARRVKISDLKDNMNLIRIKRDLTNKDFERIAKYHRAYLFLTRNERV